MNKRRLFRKIVVAVMAVSMLNSNVSYVGVNNVMAKDQMGYVVVDEGITLEGKTLSSYGDYDVTINEVIVPVISDDIKKIYEIDAENSKGVELCEDGKSFVVVSSPASIVLKTRISDIWIDDNGVTVGDYKDIQEFEKDADKVYVKQNRIKGDYSKHEMHICGGKNVELSGKLTVKDIVVEKDSNISFGCRGNEIKVLGSLYKLDGVTANVIISGVGSFLITSMTCDNIELKNNVNLKVEGNINAGDINFLQQSNAIVTGAVNCSTLSVVQMSTLNVNSDVICNGAIKLDNSSTFNAGADEESKVVCSGLNVNNAVVDIKGSIDAKNGNVQAAWRSQINVGGDVTAVETLESNNSSTVEIKGNVNRALYVVVDENSKLICAKDLEGWYPDVTEGCTFTVTGKLTVTSANQSKIQEGDFGGIAVRGGNTKLKDLIPSDKTLYNKESKAALSEDEMNGYSADAVKVISKVFNSITVTKPDSTEFQQGIVDGKISVNAQKTEQYVDDSEYPLSYVWMEKGTDGESDKVLSSKTNTLQLDKNLSLGAHTFYCVVKAGNNSARSNSVTVNVSIRQTEALEVNGVQISTKIGGHRTVYSAESEIDGKKVKKVGLIYGLEGYATEEDMCFGSNSKYISFNDAKIGKLDESISNLPNSSSYVMTMKFAHFSPSEYSAKWMVRVYVQLEDGNYAYSKIEKYSIFDVAGVLYDNLEMPTIEGHQYLYDKILSVVDKDYTKKEYTKDNEVVKSE